jgi:hypothetical protein
MIGLSTILVVNIYLPFIITIIVYSRLILFLVIQRCLFKAIRHADPETERRCTGEKRVTLGAGHGVLTHISRNFQTTRGCGTKQCETKTCRPLVSTPLHASVRERET